MTPLPSPEMSEFYGSVGHVGPVEHLGRGTPGTAEAT